MQHKKLTLETVGGGELAAQVAKELQNICENIADPNIKADAVRALKIELKVKPDAKRQTAEISYKVRASLPGMETSKTTAFIAMDAGELGLYGIDTRQQDLFGERKEPMVTEIQPVSAQQQAKVADPAAPAAYAPPMQSN